MLAPAYVPNYHHRKYLPMRQTIVWTQPPAPAPPHHISTFTRAPDKSPYRPTIVYCPTRVWDIGQYRATGNFMRVRQTIRIPNAFVDSDTARNTDFFYICHVSMSTLRATPSHVGLGLGVRGWTQPPDPFANLPLSPTCNTD